MIIRGYKKNEFEVEHGWFLADKGGRSGTVVNFTRDQDLRSEDYPLGELVFAVDPGFGVMYDIRESIITYTAPPEGEVD